jgi:hypothetical protein
MRNLLQRSLSRLVGAFLILAQVGAPPAAAAAEATSPPELLITEIVPASSGTGQPYEFVELYNPTQQSISLNDYKLLYYTASPYTTPANTWTITNKQIPAGGTLVLWLKKFDYPNVPLADFNQNYGVNLSPEQVFEVKLTTSAQGLHDSAKRRVAIARPDKSVISAAYINDGVADGTGNTNKSITYRYADAIDMQKIANGQPATPGELLPEQVLPTGPIDREAPPAPGALTAEAGAGTVTLTWTAAEAPDLAAYNLYKDGQWALKVPADQTSVTVTRLTGNIQYAFTVTAVDTAGNESAPSPTATATPTHQIITQQELIEATYADSYPAFWHSSLAGPVIPGLVEDLVPQGAAYWADQDLLILSHYRDDGRPSVLTLVHASSGRLVKTLHLHQEDGSLYTGHAGGLAVSRANLWIANASAVFRIPLDDLLAAPDNGDIRFASRFQTETNASFASYADGILWVGEFYHPPTYQTKPSHQLTNEEGRTYSAWVAGYRLAAETDQPTTLDYVLAITDRIQGMAVSPDSIVLSQSYGRTNNSTLFRYPKPDLAGAPDQLVSVNGTAVPVWFLDSASQATTLPPLAEGIVSDGDRLFVLFESGANLYRETAVAPMDRLRVVSLDHWARYDTLSLTGLPPVLEVSYPAKLNVLHHLGYLGDRDVTAQAQLSVSDESIATIAEDGTVTGRAPGPLTITAQLEGRTATATLPVAELDHLELTGLSADLTVGQTVQLHVGAVFSDGSQLDVTKQATFQTALGGKVLIDQNGLLQAAKPGKVAVQATYHGKTTEEVRVLIRPAK